MIVVVVLRRCKFKSIVFNEFFLNLLASTKVYS